jgi:hypothetical protein
VFSVSQCELTLERCVSGHHKCCDPCVSGNATENEYTDVCVRG